MGFSNYDEGDEVERNDVLYVVKKTIAYRTTTLARGGSNNLLLTCSEHPLSPLAHAHHIEPLAREDDLLRGLPAVVARALQGGPSLTGAARLGNVRRPRHNMGGDSQATVR